MHGRAQPRLIRRGRSNLRLPEPLVRSIDIARARRPGFMSRNSWIAEAIREKLTSEGIDTAGEIGGSDA